MNFGGRVLAERIGNEGVPKPPLRMPGSTVPQLGAGALPVNAPVGFSKSGGGVYMPIQKNTFNFALNTGEAILLEPDGMRVYLAIRNPSNSIGNLGISFTTPPGGVETCDLELPPGQGFVWDYFIPQNRIYAFAYVGQCFAIVSYSNKTLNG